MNNKQSARLWAVTGIISQLTERDVVNASTQALNTIALQADWILERCRGELKRRYEREQRIKEDANIVTKVNRICAQRFDAIQAALEDEEREEKEEFPFGPDTSMR